MSTYTAFPSSTVLITGGSDGIGLALAARWLDAGSTVIVTGRSRAKLDAAAAAHPGLVTMVSDIGCPEQREALAARLRRDHPNLDTIVNNAGIQRRVALAEDHAAWHERQTEIDILLAGPIHLNHLLIPLLLAHGRRATIANVSSGGAYLPQPFAPVYSACKAALHSYTVNLRFALRRTRCRVVEIIPPAIRTSLAGANASHGAPLADFADAVFAGLRDGETREMGYAATATEAFRAAQAPYQAMFERTAERYASHTYRPGRDGP